MKKTAKTEKLIKEDLPAMIRASSSDAAEAYKDFTGRVDDVMGDISQPDKSDFDWSVLDDATVEAGSKLHGDKEWSKKAAAAAMRTSLHLLDGRDLRLHGAGGSFVTVDAEGTPLAYAHVRSPLVPAEYGSADPYPFKKIAEAAYVDKVTGGSDANRGEGYRALTELKGSKPHIGHNVLRDQNGEEIVAYTGTTGRILTPESEAYIREHYPDIAEKMLSPDFNPDNLAGMIDGLSGSVASRVAVRGEDSKAHIVELPDPKHPDNIDVDWN